MTTDDPETEWLHVPEGVLELLEKGDEEVLKEENLSALLLYINRLRGDRHRLNVALHYGRIGGRVGGGLLKGRLNFDAEYVIFPKGDLKEFYEKNKP